MPRFKAPSGIAAPVVVCLLLGALGGVGTALVTKPEARAQPVRFTVPREAPPSFRLRDEHGVWRTPASARGDVLVVTFIFTRCRDLCPRQAAEIKDAVLRAGGGVQVYAITVDPDYDDAEEARAWLRKMGVAGGPVHILLGTWDELKPVWQQWGVVPIAVRTRKEDPGDYVEFGPPALRPAPSAAHDEYPAAGDGNYRGRPRHAGGLDYEHTAYALLIDKHGRQRVGYPYEQLTSDLLLEDIEALKAEP
jgi:protein SCO1/2